MLLIKTAGKRGNPKPAVHQKNSELS